MNKEQLNKILAANNLLLAATDDKFAIAVIAIGSINADLAYQQTRLVEATEKLVEIQAMRGQNEVELANNRGLGQNHYCDFEAFMIQKPEQPK